jgi:hypothetical protein
VGLAESHLVFIINIPVTGVMNNWTLRGFWSWSNWVKQRWTIPNWINWKMFSNLYFDRLRTWLKWSSHIYWLSSVIMHNLSRNIGANQSSIWGKRSNLIIWSRGASSVREIIILWNSRGNSLFGSVERPLN